MDDAIRKIAARVFRADEASLSSESSPKTIARWDSLKHMDFISALEEQLGIQFTADEIVGMVSLGQVEQTIAEKKAR